MLDDRYSHCFNLNRVTPDGELKGVAGFPWVTYSEVSYLAEFPRSADESGPMHLLHSSNVIAEVSDSRWMGQNSIAELLVYPLTGNNHGHGHVAHFKRDDEEHVTLNRVAIDYGYQSGVIKSAPSAFMPPTRYASALDALWIDTENSVRYQYNNGKSKSVAEKAWFPIDKSNLQIYVETQKVDGF